jgi:hypothetical protein
MANLCEVYIKNDKIEAKLHKICTMRQGRSDGVSRVSNAYGPIAERGPPKIKFTLDIFKKFARSRKITNF